MLFRTIFPVYRAISCLNDWFLTHFTPKYTKFWPKICRNFSLFLQYDHFCTKLYCEFCVEYKSKVSKRKEKNHLDNIRHSYSSNQAVSSSSSLSEEPSSSLSLSAVPRFHLF